MPTLKHTLLHRLAASASWVDAAELRRDLGHTEAVVDDTLADLVMAGDVLFNARTLQYRLAVGPAARKAVQRLVRDDSLQKALVAAPARDGGYLVGLARRFGGQVVCAEVAMEPPGLDGLNALQALVARWMDGPAPSTKP